MFTLSLDDERNKSYPTTGSRNTPTKGWSDYANSDPITDVSDASFDFYMLYGQAPTRLQVSQQDHNHLKNHPLIADRIKHTGLVSADIGCLSVIFDVETYEIIDG